MFREYRFPIENILGRKSDIVLLIGYKMLYLQENRHTPAHYQAQGC